MREFKMNLYQYKLPALKQYLKYQRPILIYWTIKPV